MADNYKVFNVIGAYGLFSLMIQSNKLTGQDLEGNATVPVYSSQDGNNGIMGFTNQEADFNIESGHPMLIFGDHTRTMNIAESDFSAADNVKVLCPHTMNVDELLFVATSWKKRIPDMGYSRHWRKAKRVGIELPVDTKNEPDYNYMSEYVKAKKKKALDKYKAYIEKQLSQIKYKKAKPISEMEWKPFSIVSLFNMIRGREGNMAMLEDGTIPLVSAKNANNGVKGFVSARKIINGNCITLNNDGDGGAGLAYYQPSIMALDTHVTALIPKNDLNKWSLLFIANCLSQLHGFFGHGLSISNKRAERIKIMLPTNENGKPDFSYMEQYTKNIILRKYQQYLDYLNKKQQND